MNRIQIIAVRICALIVLGICLKLVFQSEPFLDGGVILAKILFGVVPIWIVAYFWSKAERMRSNYLREIRKEEYELKSQYPKSSQIQSEEKNKSTIGEIILILAAIATILGTLYNFLKK